MAAKTTFTGTLQNADYIGKVFNELKKHFAISIDGVLRGEGASICKHAAVNSRVASASKMSRQSMSRAFRANGFSLSVGKGASLTKRGKLWWHAKGVSYANGVNNLWLLSLNSSYKRYQMNIGLRNIPNIYWQQCKQQFANIPTTYANIRKTLESRRGLTAGSWFALALRCDFGVGDILKLSPKKMSVAHQEVLREIGGKFRFSSYVRFQGVEAHARELICFNGSTSAARMSRKALRKALSTRQNAFENAMKFGVFKSAKDTADDFPYVELVGQQMFLNL